MPRLAALNVRYWNHLEKDRANRFELVWELVWKFAFNAAGELGESVYGEKADMMGDGMSGDFKAIISLEKKGRVRSISAFVRREGLVSAAVYCFAVALPQVRIEDALTDNDQLEADRSMTGCGSASESRRKDWQHSNRTVNCLSTVARLFGKMKTAMMFRNGDN